MAVAWVAAGTEVVTSTTTLALVAPTVVANDVLFASIVSKNNTAVVAPSGWTLIADTTNTAAMRSYLGWKRVGDDGSGATFNFTVAGTTISFGVLVAYRGVRQQGDPHGGFSSSANALSDNVTYATLIPSSDGLLISRPAHFVAFGYYSLNLTTAGAFSGTDPTFTARVDVETATATTASLFVHDGPSLTGAATGSRTLATASTTDAVNHGYMIDLVPGQTFGGAAGGSTAKYPSLNRTRS